MGEIISLISNEEMGLGLGHPAIRRLFHLFQMRKWGWDWVTQLLDGRARIRTLGLFVSKIAPSVNKQAVPGIHFINIF